MRLLLVEDDPTLGASLKSALETHAYGVDWVQDGETAAETLLNGMYDALILDINLPRTSGLELLGDIRRGRNGVPVLLLTARDSPQQKVQGLDHGADDYMVKPFDLQELLARLRALIRRRDGRDDPVLRSGMVELDASGSVVKVDGKQLILTSKEYRVLKMLMERAGRYCTKSDIEYALYDADKFVESNTVEVAIYSLRKKLGSDFIKSIRGVGYMVEA